MGLPDFVKEIGNKLFNRDEEAAEKIKEHIEAANPGITGLEVKFSNGEVYLSGQAASSSKCWGSVLRAAPVRISAASSAISWVAESGAGS
jgi:BON domain